MIRRHRGPGWSTSRPAPESAKRSARADCSGRTRQSTVYQKNQELADPSPHVAPYRASGFRTSSRQPGLAWTADWTLWVRDPQSGGGLEPKSLIIPTIRARPSIEETMSPKLDSSRTISPLMRTFPGPPSSQLRSQLRYRDQNIQPAPWRSCHRSNCGDTNRAVRKAQRRNSPDGVQSSSTSE